MEHTPNLNLKKPGLTDNILISDINENMDVLDAAVNELQQGTKEIPDLETENKTLGGAINEVKNEVINVKQEIESHVINPMPHMFVDNGKTYRWGFRTLDGKPQFIYEEVTV
ncbi:hypothetical protein Q8G28_15335 [Lysinibacillus capsici]|uniref:hypothetical protein n=1 Tax=Lysinibacillus capsici TaxID=2115968 RepID=UPI002731DFC7|nr:hypothetical protein [Lysinibacillus capsici]MDP1394757.1 hypothetical protein [Lysinibacillus capsici]MDP1415182.1 hypothetical protein [Lysinibacillus capsici]MDP1431120.1 hypothetical protein [Lysinibacillus capsici]